MILLSAGSVHIISGTVRGMDGRLYLFSGACNALDKGTAQSSDRRRNGKINDDGRGQMTPASNQIYDKIFA